MLLSLDDSSVSPDVLTEGAHASTGNNLFQLSSRSSSRGFRINLLITLSHEHIQSVTMLPDNGVFGRHTGRINLECGRIPTSHQRASVERLIKGNSMERHKSDAANGGKMADGDANEPADAFDELAPFACAQRRIARGRAVRKYFRISSPSIEASGSLQTLQCTSRLEDWGFCLYTHHLVVRATFRAFEICGEVPGGHLRAF